MNKFAKGLLLALVIAAPVALTAPATQAKTTTPAAKTVTNRVQPVTGVKANQVGKKRHHSRKPKTSSSSMKTTPMTKTPASTTPSSTTPASTTPASTTPSSTTPGSKLPGAGN